MLSKIFHVADVHLRLFKRHKEYEQVFKRLYQYINENKDENSIIVLAGDIVHNKTDMSPELIDMTSRFLKSCADILPTILICGNHDANLNSNRLDALSPIVNSLQHSNLHYWKDSGVYRLNGVVFSVFGILDSKDKWVKGSDIKGKYKIALYHGPVIGSETDITRIDTGISISEFGEFDIVLLGDIHRYQTLQKHKIENGLTFPEIKYSGSLIGQNYGESVDEHGILVWDLKTRNAEFVKVKNDYGFVTFNLTDSKSPIPNDLPKNLRVRIKHENLPPQEIETFAKRLGKKYNIVELIKQKTLSTDAILQTNEDFLGNSRDVEFQNNLIKDLLKVQNPDITVEEIQSVLELNKETNKLLPITTSNRNVVWKPLKLEFSNMFSYGEDNFVDFTNFDGIYGIMAGNTFGKSAIFDVLCFSIYDKTTRASKASHILNNQKERFNCKISFEINGNLYFIERTGIKNPKTGAVKVDVNFWTLDDNAQIVNLNGEERDKTNAIIRDYVGTYDDFIMTGLSTQYDNQNFVEKSQRDRKELLYKFLDIFVYDDLYRIAKEESKEFQVLTREYEKENLHGKTSQIYNQIQTNETELDQINKNISEIKGSLKDSNQELVRLNKQYHPIKTNLNIDEIELESNSILDAQLQATNQLEKLNSRLESELNPRKNQILFELANLEAYKDFDDIQSRYFKLEREVREHEQKFDILNRELKESKIKENQLQNHEYDPTCQFCINNQFVKSAQKAIESIPVIEQDIVNLSDWLDIYKEILQGLKSSLELANNFKKFTFELNQIDSEIKLIQEQRQTLEIKIEGLKSRFDQLSEQKLEYLKNEELIESNNEILSNIETTKVQIQKYELEYEQISKVHRNLELQNSKLISEYIECNTKLDKYLDCIKKYRVYEFYLQAISRDGVPYKIVELVLPVLENEVNLILNSITNFNVRLEATDEKYIHAFIQYGDGNSWPVEMSSGMERFILSLAFRIALTEITSLPKSNFLAIDEGFGVLDRENILQVGKMFQYLKTQYEYLICISHIETMKDLVEKQIGIEKINGFSRINFSERN